MMFIELSDQEQKKKTSVALIGLFKRSSRKSSRRLIGKKRPGNRNAFDSSIVAMILFTLALISNSFYTLDMLLPVSVAAYDGVARENFLLHPRHRYGCKWQDNPALELHSTQSIQKRKLVNLIQSSCIGNIEFLLTRRNEDKDQDQQKALIKKYAAPILTIRGGSGGDDRRRGYDAYNDNDNYRGSSSFSSSSYNERYEDDYGQPQKSSDYPEQFSSSASYYQQNKNEKDAGRYDNQDDYNYDSDGRQGFSESNPLSKIRLPSILKTGNRQIGFILLGSGMAITMLGISLFFNKMLMRLGNLLLVAGIPITMGPARTGKYFLRKEKIRATSCVGGGIFLVFVGYPIFGIILEVFGLLNLFGNMFPLLKVFLKQIPFVNSAFSDKSKRNNSRRTDNKSNRRDDNYDYDDRYSNDRYSYNDNNNGQDYY